MADPTVRTLPLRDARRRQFVRGQREGQIRRARNLLNPQAVALMQADNARTAARSLLGR